jgi:hypothetical protein
MIRYSFDLKLEGHNGIDYVLKLPIGPRKFCIKLEEVFLTEYRSRRHS